MTAEPDCPRLTRSIAWCATTPLPVKPNRIRDGVFTELRIHFTEEQIVARRISPSFTVDAALPRRR
jgi:hypothetical protein